MKIVQIHFESIDSTNTWGKKNAQRFFLDAITVVTANEQTNGRGRFNRKWESPRGLNIYASYCFYVDTSQNVGNIAQVMSLSAVETVKSFGVTAVLKWPNDVLVQGKKIAGILTETTFEEQGLCVILGIGLNVNMHEQFLRTIDRPATSLRQETGQEFSVGEVLNNLTLSFQKNITLFLQSGFSPFLAEYRNKIHLGTSGLTRLHDNQKVWEGTYESISSDGSFNLKLESGEIKNFHVGEILYPIEN